MRSNAEYAEAIALAAHGLNACEIARATGIPRSTIREWRKGSPSGRRVGGQRACAVCGHPEHDFRALPRASYAYLLGMYLGDGSIDRLPRTWRLRIALDLGWPEIIDECEESMQAVFPRNRVLSYQPDPSSRCGVVAVYSKQLICLFPQHGRGAKHLRPIELAKWQASEDIRTLFTSTCDHLGIAWRQMNARNISIARRESVSYLDGFIGPKR